MQILNEIKEKGYLFIDDFFSKTVIDGLQKEINSLTLEAEDWRSKPINYQKPNEVYQYHQRFYDFSGPKYPEATFISTYLKQLFRNELPEWFMNEIGYRRYASPHDWISPHADRLSDKILSVTITISGSAWVNIYDYIKNPVPLKPEEKTYKNIKKVDAHLTKSGTVMFLRAPGLVENARRVIHEVMPPISEKRDILNLRMRDTVLKQPMK